MRLIISISDTSWTRAKLVLSRRHFHHKAREAIETNFELAVQLHKYTRSRICISRSLNSPMDSYKRSSLFRARTLDIDSSLVSSVARCTKSRTIENSIIGMMWTLFWPRNLIKQAHEVCGIKSDGHLMQALATFEQMVGLSDHLDGHLET